MLGNNRSSCDVSVNRNCLKKTYDISSQKKPALFYYILPIVFVVYIQTIQFIRLPAIFGLVIVLYASMLLGCRENMKQ